MRVDRGLGPGGGLKRAGNMLGAAAAAAAMEEKISERLRRGFYCKIHARRGSCKCAHGREREREM